MTPFDKFIEANKLLLTKCSKAMLAAAFNAGWNAGLDSAAAGFRVWNFASFDGTTAESRCRELKVKP